MSATLQCETDVTGSWAELRRGINLPSYGSMEVQRSVQYHKTATLSGGGGKLGICLPPAFVENVKIQVDKEKKIFDCRQCKYFFFSTVFRPALGRTQPPSQWVLAALSPGLKRQVREADHSSPSIAEVRNDGSIPPLPYISSWHSA
jgi:hypothetical protein